MNVLSVDRQRHLLRHLRSRGSGNVIDLAEALGVSESTVRRDLRQLNERGLLTRVHGGASLSELQPVPSMTMLEYSEQELRIGAAAAELVAHHSTVLITGGAATAAMLGHLSDRIGLTVVTNRLDTAYQLSRCTAVSVVVLGGVLRHDEMSLLGPLAEQNLADFHVDRAFCGAFGIDPEVGLSAADIGEAGADRRMLAHAAELVVLADASRFGRRGPVRVADVDQIDYLVTDTGAPSSALAQMRAHGVRTIIC